MLLSDMLLGSPQPRPPSMLDYINKGKGKVSEAGVVSRKHVTTSAGNLSPNRNPNFPDPEPCVDSDEEGEFVYTILLVHTAT